MAGTRRSWLPLGGRRRLGERYLPLPEPDPALAERLDPVRANVERHGWHLQLVLGDPLHLPWTYTIGLWTSFGHPELSMFGVDPAQAALLLNLMGERVLRGERFEPGHAHGRVLSEQDVRVVGVRPEWYSPYFGMAIDWYLDEFPMLQVVLPDGAGRFPDDPRSELRRGQPLLDSADPWPDPLVHDDQAWPHPGPVVLARDLDDLDYWSGRWEELPCREVAEGEFEIAVVPFLGQLVLGDRVRAGPEGDRPAVVQELTQPSTLGTIRVTPLPADDEQLARCNRMLGRLEALGIRWEWAGQELFAVAVPRSQLVDVEQLVAPLADDELLLVERVRCG
jgi:Domain of unknown function (DUF4262)/Domain of unknown function (DUF4265)